MEIIFTKCDSCSTTISVDPEVAMVQHGWMGNDYDAHFCVSCQQTSEELEASTASADEMEVFSKKVSEVAEKTLKIKKN